MTPDSTSDTGTPGRNLQHASTGSWVAVGLMILASILLCIGVIWLSIDKTAMWWWIIAGGIAGFLGAVVAWRSRIMEHVH